MQDLIDSVASKLDIDQDKSRKAVSVLLSLVQQEGRDEKVAALFDKLPGAQALADEGSKSSGGGLFGMLSGMASGPLAAVGKLQAAGLNLDQIKTLGNDTLAYARDKAGEDVVKDVTDSIPALQNFV